MTAGIRLMIARKRAVVGYLQRYSDRPATAIELAGHLGIRGTHEGKRRLVRRIVQKLHEDGFRICADCHPTEGGYWMARDAAEWRRYREAQQRRARFQFVRVRRMQQAATDRHSGQGRLFETRPIAV